MKLFYSDPDQPLSRFDVFVIRASLVACAVLLGILTWGKK